jgi:hypothetical protein
MSIYINMINLIDFTTKLFNPNGVTFWDNLPNIAVAKL